MFEFLVELNLDCGLFMNSKVVWDMRFELWYDKVMNFLCF